ncbi:bifunctional proline dehydrogenase/L-glutamate gamma-semialdehyde dehydrogenase [Cellulomonas oligotrophica]|uniref:L-glutamate gamma-semialdehyde dehydrogenase n=1 Tax=Cellulomonas oligotrophica TaxID=931536 RepID=A0A7Y9FCR9_9CELL|nr:bifunctional proline dehydrogenase/L-glutamate gamma-semialdehyde dehydrogenase [Cellulomonas oligotrophica]NYD84637.1 RHH-type proline utilization regulon transcriptional repressor/proline dehydrogenase/delta 1-pyrroline-5-carboxylate dehydrogenase [Cellulomonas oligotrophica]GIG31704.1 1-pyrroline-5-carboxylate dehydrogenase [Cellulomonas oligotrophica]
MTSPSTLHTPAGADATDPALAQEAVALVRRWLREAADHPVDPSAAQLAAALKDPDGLPFVVGFVDGVVRPEDRRVAARTLRDLSRRSPAFLPGPLRAALRVGGALAPALPDVVVPVARRVLREMVGHLVVDASDRALGHAIDRVRRDGVRLNVNLLGEAVLGRREADRRLAGTRRLLARDDVDYVSIKVSATDAPHSAWSFDETVAEVVEHLAPLFALAAASPTPKFVNLDMEEYKDLDLTVAVFTRLLDRPELERLEAGIVLQAYLPDALAAMQHLQSWAAERRARGGAGIKVRLVKGANLPMEQVEAELHGWPLATWGTKQDTDTGYKRVLDWALHPERVANVRLGVAGHNLFDVAYAWLLAGRRGVRHAVEMEMLLGMAQGQAEAVLREVGGLLLYTPVVHPREFDVAIAYLIRRLEEGASSANFMSAVFDLDRDEALFARERDRFLASLAALDGEVPGPHRVADRHAATPPAAPGAFQNTPDTDPSVPANRAWVRDVLARVPGSTLGQATIAQARVDDAGTLDEVLRSAQAAGRAWGARPAAERAAVLDRAGRALEEHRGRLLEVMAAEAGKTVDQGDPEVSEAVDFAHWYAELARGLADVDGARFVPAALTLVTPPWNFPVAIPAGSTLAALAAGSAVVLKPAAPAQRCGAVLAEALWEAGVPRDVLHLVQVDEQGLGRDLVAHPAVDRVVLTGAYETAELFRSFRPDLPLLAETSGKNAIVVTPSADLDLAVRDVVQSAFGHAGQKCSAASLVILVGSVTRSRRFRDQLLDATASLVVGPAHDPRTQMGPLVEPAAGKLLDGLTRLDAGERWALAPRRLDDEGRLWTPGIRTGVARGSRTHLTEYFGPVLGVMTAATLQEAVALQNDVAYGLTAGLHSLDRDEIATWLGTVEAGNLYVNRGTTGAIVRRQPFGGWKRSAVGPGSKAGGPSYLLGLGSWQPGTATQGAPVEHPEVRALLDAAAAVLDADDLTSLGRAAASDALAWAGPLAPQDPSGLRCERDVLRHLPLPVPVLVRAARGARTVDVVRVLAAAALVGTPVVVSADSALATTVPGTTAVHVEDADAFAVRVAAAADAHGGARVRVVGGDGQALIALAHATGGRPDVAVWHHPVTEAGRVEILPFVREQAVSVTAHRFGTPHDLVDGLLGTPVPRR